MYNIHSINKNKNTRKTEELYTKKIAKYIHVLLLSKNNLVKMRCCTLLEFIIYNKRVKSERGLRRKWNYSSEFGSERIRADQNKNKIPMQKKNTISA